MRSCSGVNEFPTVTRVAKSGDSGVGSSIALLLVIMRRSAVLSGWSLPILTIHPEVHSVGVVSDVAYCMIECVVSGKHWGPVRRSSESV